MAIKRGRSEYGVLGHSTPLTQGAAMKRFAAAQPAFYSRLKESARTATARELRKQIVAFLWVLCLTQYLLVLLDPEWVVATMALCLILGFWWFEFLPMPVPSEDNSPIRQGLVALKPGSEREWRPPTGGKARLAGGKRRWTSGPPRRRSPHRGRSA